MPLIETKGAASAQGFGLTLSSGPVNYIEDVFSTYLYTGNGSTQTITNGIDLSGKGGLVWIKGRSNATDHVLYDTTRGATKNLISNSTAAETTQSTGLTAFSGTGFSIGALAELNSNTATYASWTFREQPKFFDVVGGLTSDSSGNLPAFNHSLASVPGCVFLKATNSGSNWVVYHRGLSGSGANQYLYLNLTAAAANSSGAFVATSTTFQVASGSLLVPDVTYVAYLFAHNAGGFGLSGSDNVISCGSFTANGSGVADVNLGYEPQWILFKPTSLGGSWQLLDTMRGWSVPLSGVPTSAFLYPNTSGAETSLSVADGGLSINATGFGMNANDGNHRDVTFIYIAIRRGPMKVPTSGTSVYTPSTAAISTNISVGFPSDLWIGNNRDATGGSNAHTFASRLTGTNWLRSANTAGESTGGLFYWDLQNSFLNDQFGGSRVEYFLRRAPNFFDEVCYTGTGSNTTQTHNLGVVPELIIVKRRDTTDAWDTYSAALSNTEYLVVNTTAAKATGATRWNSTTPTSTVFSLGTSTTTNASGGTYVAYLFATCAGVSKVGTYTGTGALQTINCGFTGGSRFVLIKRTDSTGDWYVYDSARGISSGNDPYFFLNSTAAEVTGTNYVDTTSVGFQVTAAAPAGLNANGGTYIFLAIA